MLVLHQSAEELGNPSNAEQKYIRSRETEAWPYNAPAQNGSH